MSQPHRRSLAPNRTGTRRKRSNPKNLSTRLIWRLHERSPRRHRTFSVTQDRSGSVIKSEFKTENDPNGPPGRFNPPNCISPPTGTSAATNWKEMSPEQASSVVVPNDQFLSQKWNSGPQTKDQEQPYLLPTSTSILDDYFFVHREILVWKFLAASCKQEKWTGAVPSETKSAVRHLGSAPARLVRPLSAEYLGREKSPLKATSRNSTRSNSRPRLAHGSYGSTINSSWCASDRRRQH